MKKHILTRTICCLVAVVMAAAVLGCSKKDDKDKTNVVVERTLGATAAPAPTPTPSPTPEPTAEPSPAGESIQLAEGAEALAYINRDEVNMREEDSTNSNVITKLAVGSVVSVIKKDYGNGWSQIEYEGTKAFVATQYITLLTTNSTVTIESTAKATTADLKVRADNTTDSLVIGKLADGEEVSVVMREVGHGWSMVLYQNRIAFVSNRYLDFGDAAEPAVEPTPSA